MTDSTKEVNADAAVFSVDREKGTPFLIRVFVNHEHLSDDKYADPTNLPGQNEHLSNDKHGQIHIHT